MKPTGKKLRGKIVTILTCLFHQLFRLGVVALILYEAITHSMAWLGFALTTMYVALAVRSGVIRGKIEFLAAGLMAMNAELAASKSELKNGPPEIDLEALAEDMRLKKMEDNFDTVGSALCFLCACTALFFL